MEEKYDGVWIWLQILHITGDRLLQIVLSLSY